MEKIHWHEGMLLCPEHLQYNNEYLQYYVNSRVNHLSAYCWGIAGLEFNHSAISSGVIEIVALCVLFQDGSLANIPENAFCKPLYLDVSEDRESIEIHLALAVARTSAAESRAASRRYTQSVLGNSGCSGGIDRYRVAESAGKNIGAVTMSTLQYQLYLYDHCNENDKSLLQIKLAEVSVQGGEVKLKNYIPPLLQHRASAELLKQLKHYSAYLRGIYQGIQNSTLGYDALNLLLATCLRRLMSKLHRWINRESCHPFDVFTELENFYAELCAILNSSLSDEPEVSYRHDRIYSCFTLVFAHIRRLIDSRFRTPKILESLRFDGTYYFSRLQSDWLQADKLTLLIEGADSQWLNSVKIASREIMPLIIANSLKGIAYQEYTPSIPYVSRNRASRFIQIQTDGEIWESMEKNRNIAVYAAKSVKNCKMYITEPLI